MRLQTLCLSLGLVCAAATPEAMAADWNKGGSIKDRGGIAVPAPIPVQETFKWYLRADVGGGLYSGGDATTVGNIYGFDRDPAEGPPFGLMPAWFNGGFDTFAVGGIGAGLYIGPRLRADVTVDTRTPSKFDVEGRYMFRGDPAIYDNPTGSGYEARISGHAREQIQVRTSVALANLYLDLAERGSRFVPYIGAGVGFGVRSIDRRHTTVETLYDLTTNSPTWTVVNQTTHSAKSRAAVWTPAAALMAGFGYTLDAGMVLDFGYRFAYVGEVDHTTNIGFGALINGVGSGASKLSLGETHEHAIRAGVRWNVW